MPRRLFLNPSNLSAKSMWAIVDSSGTNQLYFQHPVLCSTNWLVFADVISVGHFFFYFLFWSKIMSHLTAEGWDRLQFNEHTRCLLLNFSPTDRCTSQVQAECLLKFASLFLASCNGQWVIFLVVFRKFKGTHFNHIWKVKSLSTSCLIGEWRFFVLGIFLPLMIPTKERTIGQNKQSQ